jgi:acyl-CoA thioesterase-1
MMIVCIGDSITYGQHLADRTKPWPRLLDYDDVISLGIPGDTTRLGLERFPKDVQEHNPDIVIIQFGHNDCHRWETDHGLPRVSLAAYRANLIEMIDRCRTFEARPLLCTLTPSLRSNRHAVDVEIYDRMLRQVAADEAAPIIDVRAAFQAKERLASLVMPDGLHLSIEGHEVYAAAVMAVLKGMV